MSNPNPEPRGRSEGIQRHAGDRLFSIGMAVATIGIFVGRELRHRYKFKRRTPMTSTPTPASSKPANSA